MLGYNHFYQPQGKVMFSEAYVSHSVHGERQVLTTAWVLLPGGMPNPPGSDI